MVAAEAAAMARRCRWATGWATECWRVTGEASGAPLRCSRRSNPNPSTNYNLNHHPSPNPNPNPSPSPSPNPNPIPNQVLEAPARVEGKPRELRVHFLGWKSRFDEWLGVRV
eukprot:scaffold89441_cov45-Phaeocystis_antarctica.AAC.1